MIVREKEFRKNPSVLEQFKNAGLSTAFCFRVVFFHLYRVYSEIVSKRDLLN